MKVIYAIELAVRVDGLPSISVCGAGNLARLFWWRPLPSRRPHSVRPSVDWRSDL